MIRNSSTGKREDTLLHFFYNSIYNFDMCFLFRRERRIALLILARVFACETVTSGRAWDAVGALRIYCDNTV